MALPLALALPFNFWVVKDDSDTPSFSSPVLTWKSFPAYTLTGTEWPTFPTPTGTFYPTGATGFPTASGLLKRDVPWPSGFPTASGFSFPTAASTGISLPTGPAAWGSYPRDVTDDVATEERRYAGARRGNEVFYYPLSYPSSKAWPTISAPTIAPSFVTWTGSGFPLPTA